MDIFQRKYRRIYHFSKEDNMAYGVSFFSILSIMIVCTAYFIEAVRLPFGSINEPGPGFFPVIIGAIGTILSTYVLGESIKNKESARDEKTENITLLFLYIGSLIGLVIFFKWVGSLFGVFLLVLLLMKASRLPGWRLPVVVSIIASFVIYIVFGYWLKVSLPAGILAGLI